MNLLSVVLVVAMAGAAAACVLLRAALGRVVAPLRRVAPGPRVRWALALLAAPSGVGALGALVAFGPCLRTLLLGMSDACRSHGGPEFFFCLRMPMHDTPVAWAAGLVVVAWVVSRLAMGTHALVRTRSALGRLRRLGTFDAERGFWLVPGDIAIVAGFPRAQVYVGERLESCVSSATFNAVIAHERAHQRRRDLRTKLVARAVSLCLPTSLRTALLGELDLAMEQACDAIAADEIGDALTVAGSLLELVRAAATMPEGFALAFSAPLDHLEARVRALCAPEWSPSGRAASACFALCAMTIVGCVAFDLPLHDMTESLFERLLG